MVSSGISFFAMLLMLFAGGGSGDLLSFLPTEAYWKQQGVETVNVQTMTPYLNPDAGGNDQPPDITALIDQLGAPDYQDRQAAEQRILAHGEPVRPQLEAATEIPDPQIADAAQRLLGELKTAGVATEVRQLMAIRALGELEDAAALDALRPLTESDAPFVADYAERAIARIQDKPYDQPGTTDARMRHDLMALPKGLTMVGQFRYQFEPLNLDAVIEQLPMMMPNADPERIRTRMVEGMVDVAHQIGNLRLDGATVGMVGHPDRDGHAVVLVRGAYDPEALAAWMKQQGGEAETIAGKTVLASTDMRMVLLDAHRLLLLAGEDDANLPVADTIAAAESGKGGLADDAAMRDRINNLNRANARAWGVMDVLPEIKTTPLLGQFERIALVARPQAGEADGDGPAEPMMSIEVIATAADADTAAAAMQQLQALVQTGLGAIDAQVAGNERVEPFLQPYRQLLENIDLNRAEATATLRTRMPMMNPARMFSPMIGFMFWSLR